MKIIVSPLIAVSILNQAELIKKLIIEKGYDVEFKNTITVFDINDENNKAFLWFTLATVNFLGDAVFPYLYCQKPKAIYVTIEGVPTKTNLIQTNIDKLEFIANSNFTAECLSKSGLKVIDVVHHAIDIEMSEKAMKAAEPIKKQWLNEFEGRCKILFVGRNDPRKRLDQLFKSVASLLLSGRDDFVLLTITDINAEEQYSEFYKLKNIIPLAHFGSLRYFDVLKYMAAADFLVFPSVCEGFGLPVLEANSVGTPVIHCWMPPLSEFSSQEFNFVFPFEIKEFVNQGNVQFWIFHEYLTEVLTDMISFAVDCFLKNKKEYNEYRAKAIEHAKNFDYHKIYPKLLKHLEIE